MLNEAATADAVLGATVAAAKILRKAEILLLTNSGHGGQVADLHPAFQRARRGRMPRA
jgi:hypothetical protein